MRNQAHSLMSLVMVAGVVAAGFIGACGGKVVVDASNPSGGGGAGGGFQAATSQVGTGSLTTGPIMTSGSESTGAQIDVAVSVGPDPSSVVSVGPGSSSSTGGPNTCEDACNKSSMCGLEFCGKFNINCANPLPEQAQCPLSCIANASCGDIQKLAAQNFATPLGACIFGCQGMGPGSTGGGPPPPQMGCQQCTLQKCGSAIFACNSKQGPGSCSQWLQCAQGCGTDSMCLFGCDSQFPNAEPQYDAVYQCLCDKCDASCASEDACLHTGP